MKNVLCVFAFLLFMSCQSNDDKINVDYDLMLPDGIEIEPPRTASPPPPPLAFAQLQEEDNKELNEALVIKTAILAIEVKNHIATKDKIGVLLKQHEGLIMQERQEGHDYELMTVANLRVKPKNFNALMRDLEGLADHVTYKDIESRDVTEEFTDHQARLKSKRAIAQRYREILTKANSVAEIIEVEKALGDLIEDIEVLEGKLRYMKDQVRYSTIVLTYSEKLEVPFKKKEDGFAVKFGNALGDGWNNLLGVVLSVFSYWPLWLLVVFGGVFSFKKWKKYKETI